MVFYNKIFKVKERQKVTAVCEQFILLFHYYSSERMQTDNFWQG